MAHSESAGGFLHPSPVPLPACSASTITSFLPRQRIHPLRSGSPKESAVINYVDSHILAINRRHAKKFSGSITGPDEADPGYENFREVAKDIEAIVDVLWVSATPSLQIPYLISLAVLVNSYLPDFPFSPGSTFHLVRKLDAVFASLIQGEDIESGATLPGFEGRRGVVSTTEKVRIKSITESTRIVVVDVQDKASGITDDDALMDLDNASEDDEETDVDQYMDTPGRWEMECARVYEKTVQILGDELGKQEIL